MTEDNRTIFCGNLSNQITEELLYELFLQAGPIESIKIPTDREGRQSSFGFITMKHEISVQYACQLLEGTRLFDRRLTIRPRNPNQKQPPRTPMDYNPSPDQMHFEPPPHVADLILGPPIFHNNEKNHRQMHHSRHHHNDDYNNRRENHNHQRFGRARHDNYKSSHRGREHRDKEGRNNRRGNNYGRSNYYFDE